MTDHAHDLEFQARDQPLRSDLPYLDQYFGLWAIMEAPFRAGVERLQDLDLHAHITAADVQQLAEDSRSADYPTTDSGVAVLEAAGVMMKHASSLSAGFSTVQLRRLIRAAARSGDVSAILIRWDSPGGTVSGTADLAAEIARAAELKPVYSFVEDLAASAAVWASSQATKVYANNKTAIYGAIGTYAVVEDSSAAAEVLGVRVHVIRAGELKGAGTPGTKVTAEQLEQWQRLVDSANAQFLAGVAKGRGMTLDQVQERADGRAHPAEEAVRLGLLDGIKAFDEVLGELEQEATATKAKGLAMTKQTDAAAGAEPKALTIAELKGMFPNASAEFVLGLAERAATKEDAQLARIDALEADAAEQKKRHAEELDKAKASETAGGVEPLVGGGKANQAAGGDPIAEFDSLVREKMERGVSLIHSRRLAARENPGLHLEFLKATNPSKKALRLIDEKYDALT